jgi:hypothetical protein
MITIKDLIQNISSGQSTISSKYIIKALNDYYISIKNKIEIHGISDQGSGALIHFKVPSESRPGLMYDIVIYVSSKKINQNTQIKVYSNSPLFAYNFSYVFYKKKSLLYPDLYPREFLTLKPKIRNPFNSVSFDKQVFSCIKYISNINISRIKDSYNEVELNKITKFSHIIAQPVTAYDNTTRFR